MYKATVDDVCQAIATSIHFPVTQSYRWITKWGFIKDNLKNIKGLRPQLLRDYNETYKEMKSNIEVIGLARGNNK